MWFFIFGVDGGCEKLWIVFCSVCVIRCMRWW